MASRPRQLQGLSTLPAEIHIEILSHLPTLEDQISASLSYRPWHTLLVGTESLRKYRYANGFPRSWKQPGLHHILSPNGHNFVGILFQSGKIKSYNLYTFALLQPDFDNELAWTLRYRKNNPHRYPPGKRTFECDDEELGIHRREFTDFKKLIKITDISECKFLDEPVITPYVPDIVREEDWKKSPLDFSYENDRIEWAYLGKMLLDGFPISIGTSEGPPKDRYKYREFHVFPVSNERTASLTVRDIAGIVAERLVLKIPEPPYDPYKGWRQTTAKDPDCSMGVMRSQGMDPDKEHIVLIDHNWYCAIHGSEAELGATAIIIPCDEERKLVISKMKDREYQGPMVPVGGGYNSRQT